MLFQVSPPHFSRDIFLKNLGNYPCFKILQALKVVHKAKAKCLVCHPRCPMTGPRVALSLIPSSSSSVCIGFWAWSSLCTAGDSPHPYDLVRLWTPLEGKGIRAPSRYSHGIQPGSLEAYLHHCVVVILPTIFFNDMPS